VAETETEAEAAMSVVWMCWQIFTQCIHVQTITRSFVRLSCGTYNHTHTPSTCVSVCVCVS